MLNSERWALSSLLALSCVMATAETPLSPRAAQAETVVKRAVTYAKANGMPALIQQTNQADGRFHAGPGVALYLFVYDQQGICRGIGFSPKDFVGKNRLKEKDPDGKLFIAEMIEVAKTKGSGWVNYKHLSPKTNVMEAKSSYVEMFDGMLLGCGFYLDK